MTTVVGQIDLVLAQRAAGQCRRWQRWGLPAMAHQRRSHYHCIVDVAVVVVDVGVACTVGMGVDMDVVDMTAVAGHYTSGRYTEEVRPGACTSTRWLRHCDSRCGQSLQHAQSIQAGEEAESQPMAQTRHALTLAWCWHKCVATRR